tara:strand:- start:1630 stop:1872 length:243 start_codon:yes stop_codon:yes gene_type:complete
MTNMFEPDNEVLKIILELAKIGEDVDPIDWSGLNVTEQEAYTMMAAHVTEMELDDLTARSIIVKLLVENFVLNLKLLGKK